MLRQTPKEILESATLIANNTEAAAPPPLVASNSLLALKLKIKQLEVAKYPVEVFDVKHFAMPVHDEIAQVLFVKTKPGVALTELHLKHMAIHALHIRQLSIIGGILQALDTPGFAMSDHQELKKILEGFIDLVGARAKDQLNKLQRDHNFAIEVKANLASFMTEIVTKCNFNKELSDQPDEAINKIRSAEKFFVADLNANRILINDFEVAGKRYTQMDLPENNELTHSQYRSMQALQINPYDENAWYSYLPEWEKSLITQMMEGPNFSTLFQSSAMQGLPGIKNARTNFLFTEKADGTLTQLSALVKTATPDPYEMPKRFRLKHTIRNIRQIIESTTATAQTVQDEWASISGFNQPQQLYYFQSLLSESTAAEVSTKLFIAKDLKSSTDADLVEVQNKAYAYLAKLAPRQNRLILSSNDAINGFRVFNRFGHPDRWKSIEALIKFARPFKSVVLPPGASEVLKTNQALVKSAISSLNKLRSQTRFLALAHRGRNAVAYKTAYASILAEAVGGVVVINCKSAKDRTGVHELYCQAMRIYFDTRGKLPQYNDTGNARKTFVDIFVDLFNTWKIQEAAAANTPGSLGIKDENLSLLLCDDIRAALGFSHTSSNDLASLNKASVISHSEKKQALQTRTRDAEPVLSGKKTKKNYFDKKNQQNISAFIQKLGVLRLKVNDAALDNPMDYYQPSKKHLNYTLPALPNENIINFVPNLRIPGEAPGVYVEKRTTGGSSIFEMVKLPAAISAEEIFKKNLASANIIDTLPAGATLESLCAEIGDQIPTLDLVQNFLTANSAEGLTFKLPHTVESVSHHLMKTYAQETQVKINGRILPNQAYLDFAYAQIMAYHTQFPSDIIVIYRNKDPLLAMAYEMVCISEKLRYEKHSSLPKLTLANSDLSFVKQGLDLQKKLISQVVPPTVPLVIHQAKSS